MRDGMPRSHQLPSLTPMRGIAALLVLGYHLGRHRWFAQGFLAVDFFFVLSGFVLMHVYGGSVALSPGFYQRFIWARIRRIWPLTAFAALLGAILLHQGSDLLPSLLLARVPLYTTRSAINPPEWSVCAEFWLYLFFPLGAWAITRIGRGGARVAIILCALAVILRGTEGFPVTGWAALMRAFPEFCLGMLAYRAFGLDGVWRRDGALAIALFAMGAALLVPRGGGLVAALSVPLILAGAGNRGRLRGSLNSRPMVVLGEISFALYIGQFFAISVVARLPVALGPATAAAGILSVIFAGVLHYWVGEPARRVLLPVRKAS